jgi:hypothetical protein
MKCSNCGGEIHDGAAIKPSGTGWRHPSKCGNELRELVVRRPSGRRRVAPGTERERAVGPVNLANPVFVSEGCSNGPKAQPGTQ